MDGAPAETRPRDWVNISFLTLTPLVGIVGTALYTWHAGFALWMPALLVGMYLLVGISICAGYHRYFSHKSYECRRGVEAFYAVFGAMAAQNSILEWSAGHRVHHRHADEDWDPYSIRRGFWWAHILWIFYRAEPYDPAAVRDLERNPLVRWQARWYKPILVVGGFGLPAAVGAVFGDALAGLLWGGFLRIAVIHHTTFFVNSLAHFLGAPRFDLEATARDNWMVALLTLGEGYHSFHHRFPSDYRNGVRWYHWDPAKWFIGALASARLAWDLRETSAPRIEHVRLQVEVQRLERHIADAPEHVGEEVRRRLEAARATLVHAISLWRRHAEERAAGLGRRWRETRRQARARVREARREWRAALRLLAQAVKAAEPA
jgi:stearoyl-CoA desaturase (delta-9 desaturase)